MTPLLLLAVFALGTLAIGYVGGRVRDARAIRRRHVGGRR